MKSWKEVSLFDRHTVLLDLVCSARAEKAHLDPTGEWTQPTEWTKIAQERYEAYVAAIKALRSLSR